MATRRPNENGVLIRTRTRASLLLPRFDSDEPLVADAARFDKLELARDFILTGIPWDHDGAAELVPEAMRERWSIASRTPLDSRCSAFRLCSDGVVSADSSIKLELGAMAGAARWLVGISIKFRTLRAYGNPGSDDHVNPRLMLKVSVSMSPTRLSAHARMREVERSSAEWWQLLTSDAETYRAVADQSVSERHDNLLPSRFLQPVSEPTNAIAETTRYLAAVDALVEHLVGAPVLPTRPLRGPWLAPTAGTWTVQRAETYWEFGHVDAIQFVRQLRPVLWSISKAESERVWALEDGAETISFTAGLTASVRAAIYPKAVDRVRFEVRHIKRVPGSNLDHLSIRLEEIANDAAARANRARAAVNRRYEGVRSSPPDLYLDRLCELTMLLQNLYADRPDRSSDILRLLLSRGGIRCQGDEFPVSVAEAQALKRRGIVESSRLSQASSRDVMYSLAPAYHALFELFSGLGPAGGDPEEGAI